MVQSVERAINLLKILNNSNKKCSLSELSELSDLAPSTVHRLLLTLKRNHFVSQDDISSEYYLGSALISMGIVASNYLDIREKSYPILNDLANSTGEDAYIYMLDGNYGFMVQNVPGPNPLKIIGSALAHAPLHCGAARKVLLAYKDEDFIKNYLSKNLVKCAENTVTDPIILAEQLQEIRNNGYALSMSEHLKGATGMGAPVFDSSGGVVASIGIMGPSIRITEDKYSSIIYLVKKHARELSISLGAKNQ
ncbi:MAG: IclR family transcriptional regulator [Acidaminococcaceae bacterium]